jgi:TnpA family transposase
LREFGRIERTLFTLDWLPDKDLGQRVTAGLNLVVTAIILWNTSYLERTIGALGQQGRQVNEGLPKHVAPVHWNYIDLTGDYSWRQNKRLEKGGFWPLRISP